MASSKDKIMYGLGYVLSIGVITALGALAVFVGALFYIGTILSNPSEGMFESLVFHMSWNAGLFFLVVFCINMLAYRFLAAGRPIAQHPWKYHLLSCALFYLIIWLELLAILRGSGYADAILILMLGAPLLAIAANGLAIVVSSREKHTHSPHVL